MKLRRTLIGAALAVAATMGMTVPLATPASAASCGEVQSAVGSSYHPYRTASQIDVTPTLRVGVANCAGISYRYSVYVFEKYTIYGSASVSGTDASGRATLPRISTSGLPSGATDVGLGYKVEYYNFYTRAFETVSKHAWRIRTSGQFDTATGQNTSPYVYSTSPNNSCYSYAYSSPCLPF